MEKGGQGQFIPFTLKGVESSTESPGVFSRLLGIHGPFINHTLYISTLAVAQDGTVWVGGETNAYMDIASSSHSSAYLAKLDHEGNPIWEKVLSTGDGVERVNGMTLLRSDDLVVLIKVAASSEAVYIESSWADLFHAKPVELSKLAFDGNLLWSKEVPDTIKAEQTRVPSWYGCAPTLAAMSDGEVLLACAIDHRLQLYQFDRHSGSYKESQIALPKCQSGHPASLD